MPATSDRTPTGYPHIVLDERGRRWIDDTSVKLVTVVLDHISPDGMTPEQILAGRSQLSPAQVHAALAYYFDNREAVDAEIARADEEYLRLRQQTENPDVQARLRTLR